MSDQDIDNIDISEPTLDGLIDLESFAVIGGADYDYCNVAVGGYHYPEINYVTENSQGVIMENIDDTFIPEKVVFEPAEPVAGSSKNIVQLSSQNPCSLGMENGNNKEDIIMEQIPTKPRKWKHKQVNIKTMEGKFSVPIWNPQPNTGDDDDDDDEEGSYPKPFPANMEYIARKKKIHDSVPRIALSDQNQLRGNTVDRRIPCPLKSCDKTFRTQSAMRKHTNTHGPRCHVCQECGKAFIENSKLKRHHLVHTGEKPFQCTFDGCGRYFSLDFNLRTHTRIHTGDKPFVCPFDLCYKRFSQLTNLKSHLLTHGKGKVNSKSDNM